MKRCTSVVIAALAAVIMLIGVLPATAQQTDLTLETKDVQPGGKARLYVSQAGRLTLAACDQKVDGAGVRASASYSEGNDRTVTYRVRDVDGAANGNCQEWDIDALKGKEIDLQVCLRDHDGNRDSSKQNLYCNYQSDVQF